VADGRWRKKTPQILARIEQLLKEDVAGDPISGLRWTRSTTGKIARQLLHIGIQVSANTVGRLLAMMNFSLKTHRKNIESGFKRKPGHRARRNRQFMLINAKRRKFHSADLPVISVDGKKRELIGNFKNHGKTWRREAQEVNDHDFPSDATGVALPYGIYDVGRNAGMVVLGTSRETPAFAVDAVERWWRSNGRKHYPDAAELLILADSSGANGLSLQGLEVRLAAETLQSPRTARHRLPLPTRGIEVEPHRAPHVQRDQQELAGSAAANLRNRTQLYLDHQDSFRIASHRNTANKDLPDRRACDGRGDGIA
jgi:hypothetical protein